MSKTNRARFLRDSLLVRCAASEDSILARRCFRNNTQNFFTVARQLVFADSFDAVERLEGSRLGDADFREHGVMKNDECRKSILASARQSPLFQHFEERRIGRAIRFRLRAALLAFLFALVRPGSRRYGCGRQCSRSGTNVTCAAFFPLRRFAEVSTNAFVATLFRSGKTG